MFTTEDESSQVKLLQEYCPEECKMKKFISIDPPDTNPAMQTPLEEYPGFLGYQTDDGILVLSSELDALNELDWRNYFIQIDELNTVIKFYLNFDGKEIEFQIPNANDSLPSILELIPAIEVQKDLEYGYHIFFLKTLYTSEEVEKQVDALVAAIKEQNKKININP